MNKDMAVNRLELVSAKAKQLAEDLKHNRLWDGDLSNGIVEILNQLRSVEQECRRS